MKQESLSKQVGPPLLYDSVPQGGRLTPVPEALRKLRIY
jgi:hypothetical protein